MKQIKRVEPLPRYRRVLLAALAVEVNAELVEDADILTREMDHHNMYLVEWGPSTIEQRWLMSDGTEDWGPLAPPAKEIPEQAVMF